MKLPKQIVNVIGLVVVLAIVAAGALVVALPMVVQAESVKSQTAVVAASNDSQQAQVDALTAKQADVPDLEASVADLQEKIPAERRMDDVVAVVSAAATASGATVQSVVPEADQPFVVRTGPTNGVATARADSGSSKGAGAANAVAGQTQVPVTIVVQVTSASQSAAFLDALKQSDARVLQITHSTSSTNQMTVSAMAFHDSTTTTAG